MERTFKEVLIAYFKKLSWHSSRVRCKIVFVNAMKGYKKNGGIAPLFLTSAIDEI